MGLPYCRRRLVSEATEVRTETGLQRCSSRATSVMPQLHLIVAAELPTCSVATTGRRRSTMHALQVGLPEGPIIYACSNQLYKYDPETFATWMRILHRVPDRCGCLVCYAIRWNQTGMATCSIASKIGRL